MARGAIYSAALAALLLIPAGYGEAATAPRAPQDVDLALVLQVDVSGSIDYSEAQLQRKGIADAFLSKEVVDAIQSGAYRRIAVSVVFFASSEFGVMDVPIGWTVIGDQKSAAAFAQAILATPYISGRGTSISDGLALSWKTLSNMPFQAAKMVIDVSGDGANNAGPPMAEARDDILAKGVTINGLPIIDDTVQQDLDVYYRACVAGGPGSFVLPARGFADFARAIRRKLVLEISGLPPANEAAASPALRKVADAAPNPLARPPLPRGAAPSYPGGCDFPMFGGFRGLGRGFR